MDFDRLSQLKRQRDLLQEHLDWLNAEIDRESLANAPTVSPKASRLAEAFADTRPVESSLRDLDSDVESSPSAVVVSDLYSELGPDTKSAAADTKRGCLIMTAIFLGAFAALIVGVYMYY